MKKKLIMAIATIAIMIVSMMTLISCDKKIDDGKCDLVYLKVNNYMAVYSDKDYLFTYTGMASLNVDVPYTNVLNFTDIGLSPKAKLKLYTDEEMKQEIVDITAIKVDYPNANAINTFVYYIKVMQSKHKFLQYKLTVRINQPSYIPEGKTISDVDLNNPNGHVLVPDGISKVKIYGAEYNVIRTQEDIEAITDKNANYVVANNIDCKQDAGGGAFGK